MTTEGKLALLDKLVDMFTPRKGDFLGVHPEDTVIVGPNDRALCGFDNNFPIAWLVEDFGLTQEEAEWLVREVHARQTSTTSED
jgi:hypothetical protein